MNESQSVPDMPRSTRRRRAAGWLLLAGLGLVAAYFAVRASMRSRAATLGGGGTATDSSDGDERLRQLAIGTWQDDYEGKRTMTLREDGTATMVVELTGMKAMLFAPRLQFEMEWSVANGRLKKRTLRGEPATQVQLILQTMGDRVDEPILELTADRLLLLDKDGQTKYDWRRQP